MRTSINNPLPQGKTAKQKLIIGGQGAGNLVCIKLGWRKMEEQHPSKIFPQLAKASKIFPICEGSHHFLQYAPPTMPNDPPPSSWRTPFRRVFMVWLENAPLSDDRHPDPWLEWLEDIFLVKNLPTPPPPSNDQRPTRPTTLKFSFYISVPITLWLNGHQF